ncbi:hypothetical protein G0Q06_06560 [Puniceicoccales bacterium CK1056]|uniref:Uncharacterized protein n=1 Tax=Oceanipulchritudo coccoides TaxID=2706888 RepID=A0A6B2M069_9BACT|nr:hypothetical protein [Oceanipulchritudo coccoides]NDV62103.1 hypothetical protein [Oceanipulchritudo coccoides]
MPSKNQKLDWCLARIGEDMNWWVVEVSDAIHWDVDGLGLIDPRQMSYILEQCDALREYGFDADLVDEAFISLKIEKEEKKEKVRLVKNKESLLEDDNTHFALPDVIDEEKGPYADFLDTITRFRVKMLNDLIEFDQNLTVDELEDEIRERQNQEYMEGKAVHPFVEVISILEYVPEGYELDEDESAKGDEDEIDDIPEFKEEESEKLEEDETMRWDEEEEEEEEEKEGEDADRSS